MKTLIAKLLARAVHSLNPRCTDETFSKELHRLRHEHMHGPHQHDAKKALMEQIIASNKAYADWHNEMVQLNEPKRLRYESKKSRADALREILDTGA